MRAPVLIAASLAGLIVGAAAARAADLAVEPVGYGGYGACCRVPYGAIAPVVILDDEPGVIVRCWWLPPWRNRHYYPHGRAALNKDGRHKAARRPPRGGPRYSRYWTNPPVYVLDATPLIGRDVDPPRRHRRHKPVPGAVGP